MTIIVHSATELEGALGRYTTTKQIRLVLTANADLPGLTSALLKFKFSQKPYRLILCGQVSNDPEGCFLLQTSPCWSNLFLAIGSLSRISELILKRLELPLSLLTLLLNQGPDHLRLLELISVKLHVVCDSKLNVPNFIDSILDLPDLRRIHCMASRPGDWLANSNKQVATALVKMAKPNSTISWGFGVEKPYPYNIWHALERTRTGVDLYLRDMDLATAALHENDRLTFLLLCIVEGSNSSSAHMINKAGLFRSFVNALARNKTVETLELRLYPGWAKPLLKELVAVLSKLSLQKLVICVNMSSQEKKILLADLDRALETNYSLHWLEIYDLPEQGRRVRSLKHDLLLRLNRPKCGRACRKDLLATPWAMSQEKWVEQFVVLGEQGDLDALFYYLSNYAYWETSEY